jgi:RecG-like helicase
VNSTEFTSDSEWGGRPVARVIADALPRGRIVVTGTVVEVTTVRVGPATSYRCLLDDGSGQVGLLFVGRHAIPGLAVGTRCTVEGTVKRDDDGLVVWNPLYRLERNDEPRSTRDGDLHSGREGCRT